MGLPHWTPPSSLAVEPAYKSLFEVDFKDDYMNSIEAITKLELENDTAKFTFNDSIELEVNKLRKYFEQVEKIHVKQHDRTGVVFRKITLTKKGICNLSYSLDYSSSDLCEFVCSIDCDCEFIDSTSYKMNKKFGL